MTENTDRIDHAAEARRLQGGARDIIRAANKAPGTLAPHMAAVIMLDDARLEAQLALVEQQRIQNLIALARTGRATPHPLFVDEPDPWDYDARGTLRPDIAAALLIQEL